MRTPRLTLLVVTVLCAATANPGAQRAASHGHNADHPKLDRFLQRTVLTHAGHDRVRVIITARGDAGGKMKSALERLNGGVLDDHLLINAVTAELPVGRLRALAARDDIATVSIDAPLQAERTSQARSWARFCRRSRRTCCCPRSASPSSPELGKDVGVAVLDSGIVNHDQIPVTAFSSIF